MAINDSREKLLLEMYNQLWNSTNVRISVIWQSVSILIAAFAISSLVANKLIPIHLAIDLFIILCSWFIAHVIDASFWYNRNLAMITNIEKEFLNKSDCVIFPYFIKHRDYKMVTYMKIQLFFGIVLSGMLIILYIMHLYIKYDILKTQSCDVIILKLLPILLFIIFSFILYLLYQDRKKTYHQFIESSPGKDLNQSVE